MPFFFGVTEDAVSIVVLAQNASSDGMPVPLVAEWSTDFGSAADVHLLGSIKIPATERDPFAFLRDSTCSPRTPSQAPIR